MRTIKRLLIFFFCASLQTGSSVFANDQSVGVSPVADKQTENGLPFVQRPKETSTPEADYNLKKALGDTGMKVAIGVGVFVIAVLLLSKKKTAKSIPKEAIEILGTIPLGARQNIQLIRFGQKLVLVEASINGLKPISEITDPAEVHQMLDLIRPRTQQR